jgi:hypothetical protein
MSVYLTIERCIDGEPTKLRVCANFWIIEPAQKMVRDSSGSIIEPAENSVLKIGKIRGENDTEVLITVSEWDDLYEKALGML